MQAGPGPEVAAGLGLLFVLIILGVTLVVAVFKIVVWWCIFAKAGYPGALALLMWIPPAALVLLLILAFGEWPVHRELRALKAGGGSGPGV